MTIAIVGEAIIDFIANAQGEYRPHLGGSPYNVAIGLARNGESVSYLSPFSSDNFGELMHSSLRREGVQIPVQRRSRYPTSLALVTTNANKQPSYTLYRKGIADTDITFSEIATQLPADLTVLHTGSLAITPDQLPKIRELMQLMQRRSIVISLDL
ncbi:MAG: PfkB family carbohydrate kinase, partial [Pseudomonadota bacterium]|nr:PfkB family carbohydrate kinase [Pseudomonadota bacterium]